MCTGWNLNSWPNGVTPELLLLTRATLRVILMTKSFDWQFLLLSGFLFIAIKWTGFTKNNHLSSCIRYANALTTVIIFIRISAYLTVLLTVPKTVCWMRHVLLVSIHTGKSILWSHRRWSDVCTVHCSFRKRKRKTLLCSLLCSVWVLFFVTYLIHYKFNFTTVILLVSKSMLSVANITCYAMKNAVKDTKQYSV